MAKEAIVEPTKWRKRHGQVARLEETIADSRGAIGRPFRGLDTLERMAVRGRITPTMLQAGNHFHDHFRRAGLDGLHAAGSDPSRIPILSANNAAKVWSAGLSNEGARWVVRTSLDALGGHFSPCGSCAWHILGLEETIRDWCRSYQWGRGSLDVPSAAGMLIAVLSILERHYRFVKS